ncbi:MAG: hypothetical protein AAGG45_07680 [Pseudomonadota bacterium]
MINGCKIEEMEPGWEYRFRVSRGNFETKTYTREAAEKYAMSHAPGYGSDDERDIRAEWG